MAVEKNLTLLFCFGVIRNSEPSSIWHSSVCPHS